MLRYLSVIVLLYVTIVFGGVLPEFKNSKIIGGQNADITEAPYQAALLLGLTGHHRLFCGGAIISEKTILTSASCTTNTNPPNWMVRIGSTYHDSGGQYKSAKRIAINSLYASSKPDYDISLLELYEPIDIDDITTRIIPLPIDEANVPDLSFAIITGWGIIEEIGGDMSQTLQKTVVPIVNQSVCTDVYKPSTVTSRMICAGNIQTGGADFCTRDEGGPLVVNGVLVGVASWGKGCGQPNFPGVYTRVSSYIRWIYLNS